VDQFLQELCGKCFRWNFLKNDLVISVQFQLFGNWKQKSVTKSKGEESLLLYTHMPTNESTEAFAKTTQIVLQAVKGIFTFMGKQEVNSIELNAHLTTPHAFMTLV
jgi:hypothetical protein